MYFAPTSAECKKILIVIKNIKCTTCLHFLRRGNLFCMSCSAPVWTHELVCSLLFTSMLTPPPPPAGGSRVICQMRSLRAVGNPVWTRILSAVTVRQADRLHDYLWLVIQTVSLKLNILLHFFFIYFFLFFFFFTESRRDTWRQHYFLSHSLWKCAFHSYPNLPPNSRWFE